MSTALLKKRFYKLGQETLLPSTRRVAKTAQDLADTSFNATFGKLFKTLRDLPENPFFETETSPRTPSDEPYWDGLGPVPGSTLPASSLISLTLKSIREMKSQQWGGVVSCFGSLVVLTAGDGEGYFATGTFLAAEGIFMRWGATPFGQFAAWGLINTGSITLFFSRATEHNPYLRAAMVVQTLNNLCRGTEWPLQGAQALLKNRAPGIAAFLKRIEDHVPLVTNGASMFLRIPTIIASAIGGNYTMLACSTIWIGADCLLGKVQDSMGQFLKVAPSMTSIKAPMQKICRAIHDFPENPFVHSPLPVRVESNGPHWDGLGPAPHAQQIR